MYCKDAEFLSKEYLRDPSQFLDTADSKQDRRPFELWRTWHKVSCLQEQPRERDGRDGDGKARGDEEAHLVQQGSERWPDCFALLRLIKTCDGQKYLGKISTIHAEILKCGLLNNVYVGTALISMYAKCGALAKAAQVFDELPVQDVVAWSALISGYVQHGLAEEALKCFGQMQDVGKSPNAITFSCILKACGILKAAHVGEEVHAEARKHGLLGKNSVLGTSVVDMYAKCGLLVQAQKMFDELPVRDVVSWTSLVSGYTQHGLDVEALKCFDRMQDEGVSPNAVTLACILKACGSTGAADKGEEIHSEISKQGLLWKNSVLGTALVDMYAKCGLLAKAQKVFDELPLHNPFSWNALIGGYAQHGHGGLALKCVEQMREQGVFPNAVTFACMLKACGSMGAVDVGKEIHAEIRKHGLLEKHVILGNALVDMYAKCGLLTKAQEVFDRLPTWDIFSWSALIAGYAQHGLYEEVLKCFRLMQSEGHSPDAVVFACILKACGSIGADKIGEEIHAEVRKQGLVGKHIVVSNALLDMYAKCGLLTKAQKVFNDILLRNVVSWNVLITGYVQHGCNEDALKCFKCMQTEGFTADEITFACILKACASVGAVGIGEEIHAEVQKQGLLGKHIELGNALVDMYAKCGSLAKAQEVLDELPVQDIVSWSALIAGYSQHGHGSKAVKCFERMQREGNSPDAATFTVLLSACSHAGLVEEARMYYHIMTEVYDIIPNLLHCTCLVDLFSHAGHFDEALSVIKMVPPSDCLHMWMAFLGASHKWVNVELGRQAFESVVQLDKKYAAAYACMCNLYIDASMQEEAYKVEALRIRNEAWKIPGHCLWIDMNRSVHSFVVGDKSHPKSKPIYLKLEEIHQKLLMEESASH